MRSPPNSDSQSKLTYDIKLSHKGPPRFKQWPLNSREATNRQQSRDRRVVLGDDAERAPALSAA